MKCLRLGSALLAAAAVAVACGSSDTGGGGTTSSSGGTSGSVPVDPKPFGADASVDAAVVIPTFSVGGSVSGLSGTGLVLQNSGGDDIPVAADGSFTFPTKVAPGTAYDVTVKTQPTAPYQTCSVAAGTGIVAAGNVTSIAVTCDSNKLPVGGTVTGLLGAGLTLQNNLGNDLIVNNSGNFAFAEGVTSGTAYAVTVKAQPGTPSQTCTVTGGGSGTIAGAPITDVAIACVTNTYDVGGTVAGLVGAGLKLKINNDETLPVAANGTFKFPTKIASGAAYAVTVDTQPSNPSQTCTVVGSGTVGGGNITSVAVNCTTNKYLVSGTASGVAGTGLVLQNNLGNDLSVNANGTFAFSTAISSGAAYSVSIKTQPTNPSQTCSLSASSGTITAANVSNVALTCVTNPYKIGGTVTGLAGAGLILQNKAGDDLPVNADGTFKFSTSILSGQTYAVTVKTQPSNVSQSCTVANPNGTVGGADVANVAITCVTNKYTVSGTAAGLSGAGLVVQNNLGNDLAIAANGTFTFTTTIASGQPYSVSVKSQPSNPSQTCTLSAPSGTVTNGNIVTVALNCSTNKYTIGGSASGLAGTGLVLRNNNTEDVTLNGNGAYAFGTPIASGAAYSVAIKTQPTNPSQTCVLTTPSGTVSSSNVSSVGVACTTNTYSVGGTVTGVTGGSITLQNNGGNNLTQAVDGTFTFTTNIASGATYAVTVSSAPVGKFCSITNGTGTIGSAAVSNVSIACVVGDGTVRDVAGLLSAVKYVPCGDGTIGNCNQAKAEASCTAIGKKLVSHASDGTSGVVSLGATSSCNWSVSYFTNSTPAFAAAGQCLVAASNASWSGCCGIGQWHGNTLAFPTTVGTQFGYVDPTNSGYNAGLTNASGTTWGCNGATVAGGGRGGCTTYNVACK